MPTNSDPFGAAVTRATAGGERQRVSDAVNVLTISARSAGVNGEQVCIAFGLETQSCQTPTQ